MSIKYKGRTIANVGGGSSGVTMDQVNTAIEEKLDAFDPMDIYSTEEVRIGTWIDGKPLYRVVMEATLPTDNSWHNISTGVRNVEIVASLRGIVRHPTRTKTFYSLPTALPNGNGVILFAYYQDGYSDVYGSQGLNGYCTYGEFKGAAVKMIMEYTKTTDPSTTTYGIESDLLMNTTAVSAG